jgi:hypothetical protein
MPPQTRARDSKQIGFCHEWWRALSLMAARIVANPGNLQMTLTAAGLNQLEQ